MVIEQKIVVKRSWFYRKMRSRSRLSPFNKNVRFPQRCKIVLFYYFRQYIVISEVSIHPLQFEFLIKIWIKFNSEHFEFLLVRILS